MHRARLAALLATLTVLAAGCSDDGPEPNVEPTVTASPTESATSASPTKPTATSQTPERLNPEDTVRAWVSARNDAIQSGDAEEVRSLSTPGCETCRDLIEPIEDVYLNGGHMDTIGWRISALNVEKENATTAEVVAGLIYTAGETVPSAGADPIEYDLERHIAKFRVQKLNGIWRVGQVVYVS